MLSVQLSIIKLVFRDPCVVKARFCPLDMSKQSRSILLSPLYNFPLHREVENVNQAQTSAINSVCEFRFVLINENAPETVSYLFPTTRCKLNQIYPSPF